MQYLYRAPPYMKLGVDPLDTLCIISKAYVLSKQYQKGQDLVSNSNNQVLLIESP